MFGRESDRVWEVEQCKISFNLQDIFSFWLLQSAEIFIKVDVLCPPLNYSSTFSEIFTFLSDRRIHASCKTPNNTHIIALFYVATL